ncbi:5-formyltetrahydrofolate cyclo-ligase [Candidatus Saccharibacteria bacterium]|jgi:5-formyltetrahydrofolate cyclo-ligase|nr:5-formyltetrahydrofolate cyclo-ligase [Candidatus Saccharibacteria bacterium]
MSEVISKEKKILRKQFLSIRRAMNNELVLDKSQKIVEQLSVLYHESAQKIHCFLPLEDDNEPDLRAYIEMLQSKDCQVYTSSPEKQTGRKIKPLDIMPKEYVLDNDIKFDLIIVPMIAGNKDTNQRLGFGGGFYDRLLSSQPSAETIGVCFDECLSEIIPAEPHDKMVDTLITA